MLEVISKAIVKCHKARICWKRLIAIEPLQHVMGRDGVKVAGERAKLLSKSGNRNRISVKVGISPVEVKCPEYARRERPHGSKVSTTGCADDTLKLR
jgi:hypothetical protein